MGQPTPPPQSTLPGVGDVGGLASMLETYGGWGVAALFAIGFAVVAYAYYKQGLRYEEQRKKDTNQFVDILTKNAQVITAVTKQMERVEDKLEKVTRSNDRTDAILDDHKKLIERTHSHLDNRS